jgi:hypothetical protein
LLKAEGFFLIKSCFKSLVILSGLFNSLGTIRMRSEKSDNESRRSSDNLFSAGFISIIISAPSVAGNFVLVTFFQILFYSNSLLRAMGYCV